MSKTKGGLDDSKLDYTDNTSLPFAVFDKEDSILIVRVKIIGETVPHDREVFIEVVPGRRTGREMAPERLYL